MSHRTGAVTADHPDPVRVAVLRAIFTALVFIALGNLLARGTAFLYVREVWLACTGLFAGPAYLALERGCAGLDAWRVGLRSLLCAALACLTGIVVAAQAWIVDDVRFGVPFDMAVQHGLEVAIPSPFVNKCLLGDGGTGIAYGATLWARWQFPGLIRQLTATLLVTAGVVLPAWAYTREPIARGIAFYLLVGAVLPLVNHLVDRWCGVTAGLGPGGPRYRRVG